jgi:hypothetical protein
MAGQFVPLVPVQEHLISAAGVCLIEGVIISLANCSEQKNHTHTHA